MNVGKTRSGLMTRLEASVLWWPGVEEDESGEDTEAVLLDLLLPLPPKGQMPPPLPGVASVFIPGTGASDPVSAGETACRLLGLCEVDDAVGAALRGPL